MSVSAKVKMDYKDTETLAQSYRLSLLLKCELSLFDIEMRLLSDMKLMGISHKLAPVNNKIRALVSKNLLRNEISDVADRIGTAILRRLDGLTPFAYCKHGFFHFSRVKSLLAMKEQLQSFLRRLEALVESRQNNIPAHMLLSFRRRRIQECKWGESRGDCYYF